MRMTPKQDSQLSVDSYIVKGEKEYRIWLQPNVRYSLGPFEQKEEYKNFIEECRSLAESMNIPVEFDEQLLLAIDDIQKGDTEFTASMKYISDLWRKQLQDKLKASK